MGARVHKRIAVLVPAHNEEEVIDRSLAYAAREAGRENVYLVSDNSTDRTARFGSYWTPNVLEVARGGKARAVRAGLEHFGLLHRYDGVLVVDADSLLMPGSMRTYREHLTEGVAAVIGHLRVLKAQRGPIAAWRRHQYFWMTNVYLNGAAAYGGGFPVTPGFCTLYATSAMRHFDHDPQAPTEDIDYCWQIHRKGLGKVVYTPDAEVETAVPLTLRDYVRQILRWDRGWHYATRKHKMPIGFQWVDLVGGLMTLEMYMIWARALALVLLTVLGLEVGIFGWHLQDLLGVSFVVDAMVLMVLAFVGSVLGGNWGGVIYILVFPLFYVGDQVVNFYAAARLKRGLSAVWQSPQR